MRTHVRTLAVLTMTGLLLGLQPLAALAAPMNDDVDAATAITALPFEDLTDTRTATEASDDPDCFGAGPTVWYALTLGSTTGVEINTFGSSYDTTLSLHVGDRGSLTTLACNDDAGGSLQSRLRFTAEPGVTYLIMVGAFASGPGGDLVLSAFEREPTPPIEPVEITLTMDPTGSFDPRTGDATVSGTVTCSAPALIWLDGVVRQRAGRADVIGYVAEYSGLRCDDTLHVALTTEWTNGRFAGGRADVMTWASGCPADLDWDDWDDWDDEWPCDEDFVETTVRLRGGAARSVAR